MMSIRLTAPGNVSEAADRLESALRDLRPDYRIQITDPPFRDEGEQPTVVRNVTTLIIHAVHDDWHVSLPVTHGFLTGTDVAIIAPFIAGRIDKAMGTRPSPLAR